MVGKVAFDFGFEPMYALRQLSQSGIIDRVGTAVMGAEGDIPIALVRGKFRDVACIEFTQRGRIQLTLVSGVQHYIAPHGGLHIKKVACETDLEVS